MKNYSTMIIVLLILVMGYIFIKIARLKKNSIAIVFDPATNFFTYEIKTDGLTYYGTKQAAKGLSDNVEIGRNKALISYESEKLVIVITDKAGNILLTKTFEK